MLLKNFKWNLRNNKNLYWITIFYFAFGWINIHLALIGLVCMLLPLALLFTTKKKTWCQGYCPRASLYTQVGKQKKSSKNTPKFFVKGSMKWILLLYFLISLTIIISSTIRVASQSMPIKENLNLLLFIPIPGPIPQLFRLEGVLPWITHLAYRFYSMMMTTTLLGLLMALLYKPRTWCTVCPIATVSDLYIKSNVNNNKN